MSHARQRTSEGPEKGWEGGKEGPLAGQRESTVPDFSESFCSNVEPKALASFLSHPAGDCDQNRRDSPSALNQLSGEDRRPGGYEARRPWTAAWNGLGEQYTQF